LEKQKPVRSGWQDVGQGVAPREAGGGGGEGEGREYMGGDREGGDRGGAEGGRGNRGRDEGGGEREEGGNGEMRARMPPSETRMKLEF